MRDGATEAKTKKKEKGTTSKSEKRRPLFPFTSLYNCVFDAFLESPWAWLAPCSDAAAEIEKQGGNKPDRQACSITQCQGGQDVDARMKVADPLWSIVF